MSLLMQKPSVVLERGDILHFFNYFKEQCKQSMKTAEVREGKYLSVALYSRDNSYLVTYSDDEKRRQSSVVASFTDEKGEIDADAGICFLIYDEKAKRFSDISTVGPWGSELNAQKMLEGEYPGVAIPDSVYNLFASDNMLACLGTDRRGHVEPIPYGKERVQWRNPKGFGDVMAEAVMAEQALFKK